MLSSQSKLITFGTVPRTPYPNLNSYVISKNYLNEYSRKFENFYTFSYTLFMALGNQNHICSLVKYMIQLKTKKN